MPAKRDISRRDFIQTAGALGALALAGNAGHGAPGLRLESLRAEDFGRHLGQTFTIQEPGGRRRHAQLTRVHRGRARPNSRSFSLIFHLPGKTRLPHQTYAVSHPEMGSFALFLGAVGPHASSVRLEAVFG
jgi:hypothetical protein